eukprot:12172754-Ditylum_brightwellii.AAC.1
MLGMTRSWFAFIWRHFHVQSNTATYQEDGSDVDDNMRKMRKGKNSDGSDEEDDDLDSNCTKREAKEGGNADGERGHPRKNHA